jgi:hypothetical protein
MGSTKALPNRTFPAEVKSRNERSQNRIQPATGKGREGRPDDFLGMDLFYVGEDMKMKEYQVDQIYTED